MSNLWVDVIIILFAVIFGSSTGSNILYPFCQRTLAVGSIFLAKRSAFLSQWKLQNDQQGAFQIFDANSHWWNVTEVVHTWHKWPRPYLRWQRIWCLASQWEESLTSSFVTFYSLCLISRLESSCHFCPVLSEARNTVHDVRPKQIQDRARTTNTQLTLLFAGFGHSTKQYCTWTSLLRCSNSFICWMSEGKKLEWQAMPPVM